TDGDWPYVFHTSTSVEYWGGGRVAALVHTTPDGAEDLELPDRVRFYLLAGTQHAPTAFPPAAARGQQQDNPLDYWWSMRALLDALRAWVVDGVEPPPSAYPTLAASQLTTPSNLAFPPIPGVRL